MAMRSIIRGIMGMVTAGCLIGSAASVARAAEKVLFLYPGPESLLTYVPHQLARYKGYFADEGIDLTVQSARGGVDAAKQVAVGNADISSGMADTSIVLRANGLPVRGIAQLGKGSLFSVAARKAAGVTTLADLKGKRIGVFNFGGSHFYTLRGALAAIGVKPQDVDIEAVGLSGAVKLMVAGSIDAVVIPPDFEVLLEKEGVAFNVIPFQPVFPGLTEALISSEKMIKERPQVLKAVTRAIVRAMGDIMKDPAAAARDYVAKTPQHAGQEAEVERVLRLYVERVYQVKSGEELGFFNEADMEKVARSLYAEEIVAKPVLGQDVFVNILDVK